MTAAGLLAEVVRGGLVESEHHGHLVVLDAGGDVRLSIGDPGVTVWPRSSLKPLQAVAMLRSGLDLVEAELALACASHSGTPEHLAVVLRILVAAGLGEEDLQNTPDLPLDPAAALAWQAAGRSACSLTQNCSGKHAAMLATCVAAGWDRSTYRSPDHPLQRAVVATVEDLTGVRVEHVTVDGCGSMLPSTTVHGLARAVGRIAAAPRSAPGSYESRVALAMAGHPVLVGGPGRDVSRFMQGVPGLVAKDGAEGVYAAGLPDGSAVALKIADGSARPRAAVLAAALEVLLDGHTDLVEAVRRVGCTPVLGHGRPVGEVRATLGRPVGEVPARRGRSPEDER